MTLSKYIYKVPGGKLLKVVVEHDNHLMHTMRITGDFFMHPEEAIEALEKELEMCPLDKKEIEKRITQFVTKKKVTLFGVNASAIAEAILGASHG